jgi:toxin-antitoxin system PIN domain toxin
MTYLPDINVWMAIAIESHAHHAEARAWVERSEADTLAFCRVTEMGLLRLLTNGSVLGKDVLTPEQAWRVRDGLSEDDRVVFLPEPADFDRYWRECSEGRKGGANFWSDAYLVAFSEAAECRLVTFAGRLGRRGGKRVRVLGAGGRSSA